MSPRFLSREVSGCCAIAGVALGAGLLFGLITMLVQYVGLFMTGFHTGLFSGVVALATAEQFRWQPTTVWTSAAVLLGAGLLAAVLNLYWQKGKLAGACVQENARQTEPCSGFRVPHPKQRVMTPFQQSQQYQRSEINLSLCNILHLELSSALVPEVSSLLCCPITVRSCESWSVLCPSTPIFGKPGLKLGNQLQFKCDLGRNRTTSMV